jgi:hypothetical protein
MAGLMFLYIARDLRSPSSFPNQPIDLWLAALDAFGLFQLHWSAMNFVFQPWQLLVIIPRRMD